MMTVLALTAALGLYFEPQDIEGLDFWLSGSAQGASQNARHADVNGDGEMDLVLAESVLLQQEGKFAEASMIHFQDIVLALREETAALETELAHGATLQRQDVFDGDIYLWRLDKVVVLAWQEDADPPWRAETRPVEGMEPLAESWRSGAVSVESFLHDIDADGEPEIIWPHERGIYVIRRNTSGVYQGDPPIWPPLPATLESSHDTRLWPPQERGIAPIKTKRWSQILIYDSQAVLQWISAAGDGKYNWYWRRISLDGGEDGSIHSMITPHYVGPIPLNGDGLIDFAGGWAEPPKAGKIQRPVYETMASLDGGETYTRVRSRCVEPFVNFADINQDGRYDLVTEDVELFSLGPREMALRLAADRSSPVTVSVRLQREDERGFETAPIQGRFTVAKPLDDIGAILSEDSAWRVDITGDLDGDGWNDAVVRTAPDQLTVYKGGPTGWAKAPMAGLSIERDGSWSLYDLNADGRDDVALSQQDAEGKKLPSSLVYLSRPGVAPPNKGIVMGTKP